MGRLAAAPRRFAPARAPAPRVRAARSCRSAADGRRWTGELAEVRDVLADRLAALEVEPPAHRYGRVFVCSPDQARGRAFRIVFVPGLAERLFPQKLREDPLLLDDLRREIGGELTFRRIAPTSNVCCCGSRWAQQPSACMSRSRASKPPKRARGAVVLRARSHARRHRRIPDHQIARTRSGGRSQREPRMAGAAQGRRCHRRFRARSVGAARADAQQEDVKGHAHYMLRLNDCLRRSATERWARARPAWSQYDGLVRVTDATRPFLQIAAARRAALFGLGTAELRLLSLSISAVGALPARAARRTRAAAAHGSADERELVSRGAGRVLSRLQQRQMPIATTAWIAVLEVLDATLTRIAAKYAERLAPAVDRVWQDEIASIRTDLPRLGARPCRRARDGSRGCSSLASACRDAPGRDPNSLRDPVTIDGRFILRGCDRSGRAQAGHEDSARHRSQNIEEPIGARLDHRRRPAAPAGDLQPGRRGGNRMHGRKRAFFVLHDGGRLHRASVRSTNAAATWASKRWRSSIAPWSSACCRRRQPRRRARFATSCRCAARTRSAARAASHASRSPICSS